ncbi:asparagine-linked glycosylation 9 protein isoform a [Panaeolus papilionaceus]|nr:asparagine-linked glycosylation 9 protein isoform a [Panaeolus papilionaceus]
MSSQVQHIRFRGPTNGPPAPPKPVQQRHTGILQDQLRRAQKRPWTPSFSLAVRILLLVRVTGAMYANIGDCDEVFNFWEPLHFLDQGSAFQTWELSPKYALRSWAYLLLHILPPRIGRVFLPGDKRAAFFALRIFLAGISGLVEAAMYRTILTKINERVGRYFFFMMLFSAGMWNATTAFLPSTFAMHTFALAFSYALAPASLANNKRTLAATLLFATGAIVGWPFALAIAIPFVFEELFIYSADAVTPQSRSSWIQKRFTRLIGSGVLALLLFIPVIGIDSLAYGKLAIVPWNIIKYNIFGGSDRGPNLYGTEPWNFYLLNLVLNFNCILPLSLISLPALFVTYFVDRRRLGLVSPNSNQSSPFTILALRLAPLYLWIGILSLQPHKEERFMFPVYPLLCFNAAVSVYLIRGWMEVAYVKATSSPYRASQTYLFRNFTSSVVVATSVLSLARIAAVYVYYHAPLDIAFDFQIKELPRLLNDTALLPVYPPGTHEEDTPRIDLTPVREFELNLCLGKEWYRFPGNYLIPNGVHVRFIKSEFNGMLPRHFEEKLPEKPSEDNVWSQLSAKWWLRPQTTIVPDDLNDLNKEDVRHYMPVDQCDYLIDLDFPLHPITSPLEPRYAVMDETWERIYCHTFLDARHSFPLTRIFWFPGKAWQATNEFGDYCLLRHKHNVIAKELDVAQRFGLVHRSKY